MIVIIPMNSTKYKQVHRANEHFSIPKRKKEFQYLAKLATLKDKPKNLLKNAR